MSPSLKSNSPTTLPSKAHGRCRIADDRPLIRSLEETNIHSTNRHPGRLCLQAARITLLAPSRVGRGLSLTRQPEAYG